MSMNQKSTCLIGLENLGCTCYINACLQILFATEEFNVLLETSKKEIFKKEDESPDIVLTKEWLVLWKEWKEIQKTYSDKQITISPKRFVHAIETIAVAKNRPQFHSKEQNDFAEFLYFLVDCFHNSISKTVNLHIKGRSKTRQDKTAQVCYEYLKQLYRREFSNIFQQFYGLTVSEILYAHSPQQILSTKPEHFFMLDLEIPHKGTEGTKGTGPVTIYDCLECHVAGELLQGANAWYNEKTKMKETVLKRLSFWHFPDILIICFKRFHQGLYAGKNDTLINFPLIGLNLSPYVCGYDAHKYQYDCYATCNHYGTSFYGHYTANICRDGEWFCYNDDKVDKIHHLPNVAIGAYCLFYRRQKT